MVFETMCGNPEVTSQKPFTKNRENVLAECLALLAEKQPHLAKVISKWEELPDGITAAIMALVNSVAIPGQTGSHS